MPKSKKRQKLGFIAARGRQNKPIETKFGKRMTHNENDVTMIIAGLWRYGDWRHVATGCNVLVVYKFLSGPSARIRNTATYRHRWKEIADIAINHYCVAIWYSNCQKHYGYSILLRHSSDTAGNGSTNFAANQTETSRSTWAVTCFMINARQVIGPPTLSYSLTAQLLLVKFWVLLSNDRSKSNALHYSNTTLGSYLYEYL